MMHTVTFHPSGKIVKVRPGTTLLAASRRAGVPVKTRCGGKANCMMCKVKIMQGAESLTPVKRSELLRLGEANLSGGFRLSCQAGLTGNVVVEVPEDRLKSVVRALLDKQKNEEDELW